SARGRKTCSIREIIQPIPTTGWGSWRGSPRIRSVRKANKRDKEPITTIPPLAAAVPASKPPEQLQRPPDPPPDPGGWPCRRKHGDTPGAVFGWKRSLPHLLSFL